ncbi:MarR family winged helix-turn-helix transcriptional regulator [Pseudacidovorax sp. RU35E]|uniref:MarR family winged helix-turn-helix transcriptional regulator n=1 Tax=Pseudacidovorax sp. RU35E TaxID=1907403 RepID=UPI000955113C|nr:MarR family transcriptional regulator [Pseudacidovorax sp. RU35E]SIQ49904.1 transcriptional regulator, MarR family [Pseudacidovorax sp. RU35E]
MSDDAFSASAADPAELRTLTFTLNLLQRAYRAAADRAVAHLGISQAAGWALLTIGRQGDGTRQGVIADLLGIEGPTLIRTLDQLVGAGLVERREDPTDRRARTLHLTESGAAIQARIEEALNALRTELFQDIPAEDVRACLRVFGTLWTRLGKADRGGAASEN